MTFFLRFPLISKHLIKLWEWFCTLDILPTLVCENFRPVLSLQWSLKNGVVVKSSTSRRVIPIKTIIGKSSTRRLRRFFTATFWIWRFMELYSKCAPFLRILPQLEISPVTRFIKGKVYPIVNEGLIKVVWGIFWLE